MATTILNGQKRFIVGGEGADFFLVYAKTDPEGPPHKSMTCFIVDRDAGSKLSTCTGSWVAGEEVPPAWYLKMCVPKSNILGQVNGAVEVFYPMMIPERLGTAAMTIGAVRPALEIATDYTTKRKAFGTKIKDFQGVSFKIAEAVTKLDTSPWFTAPPELSTPEFN